jgi:hypothetical protein
MWCFAKDTWMAADIRSDLVLQAATAMDEQLQSSVVSCTCALIVLLSLPQLPLVVSIKALPPHAGDCLVVCWQFTSDASGKPELIGVMHAEMRSRNLPAELRFLQVTAHKLNKPLLATWHGFHNVNATSLDTNEHDRTWTARHGLTRRVFGRRLRGKVWRRLLQRTRPARSALACFLPYCSLPHSLHATGCLYELASHTLMRYEIPLVSFWQRLVLYTVLALMHKPSCTQLFEGCII